MSQTTTVVVEATREKSGVNQRTGRPWTKWALKDGNGNWYGTFEKDVVHDGLKGQTVEIEWEQDGNFRNLLRATPASYSPASSRAPEGGADWDLIGLRKTRCALWAAMLPDALRIAWDQWVSVQSDEPSRIDVKNFTTATLRELVISAEIDIFHRDPAMPDTDLPF